MMMNLIKNLLLTLVLATANADHDDVQPEDVADLAESFDVDTSIAHPDVPLESSIDNRTLSDVEIETEPVQLQFQIHEEASKRNKRKLTDNRGFTYNVKRRRKTKVDWQCSIRGKNNSCPATVVQHLDEFRPGPSQHNHEPALRIDLAVKITSEVRKKAKDNVFVPASSIVDDALLEIADPAAPTHSRPKQSNLMRMVNRVRQRLRPDDPVDLDFELDHSHIPDDFLVEDMDVEGQRHLMFSTNHQLSILSKAKTWYMDGTFHIVRKPFVQLYSIHAFIRSGEDMKQVPLVFVLMSRRRRFDYIILLRRLLRQLTDCRMEVIVTDFEAAVWSAVRKELSDVTLRG